MRTPRTYAARARSLSVVVVGALLSTVLITAGPADSQPTTESTPATGTTFSSEFVSDVQADETLVIDEAVRLDVQRSTRIAASNHPDCPTNLPVLDPPSADAVPVSGSVIWQYRGNNRIPVAFAEVCLFGDSGFLGRTVTDKDGRFSIRVNRGKTGIVAIAYTSSGDKYDEYGAVTVQKQVDVLFALQSTLKVNTTNGTPRDIEVLASTETEENHAFSVFQALVRGYDGFVQWLPAPELEPLIAYFPRTVSEYYPKNLAMRINAEDAWDWDVIHHELAHHIGYTQGIHAQLANMDRTHAFNANLSQGDLPLEGALALAWAEGWATYAAISLQRRLLTKYPELGDIPSFGNLTYEDMSYSGTSMTPRTIFSLVDPLDPSIAPLPDNEVVVAQFLQTLDQFNARERRPAVLPWPVRDLFASAASGGEIVDAYDAWKRLDRSTGLDSCEAADFGFTPTLLSGSINIAQPDKPLTIQVRPNGPGPRFANSTVTLAFVDAANQELGRFTKKVDAASGALKPVTFEISASRWAEFMNRGVDAWVVAGQPEAEYAQFQIPGCERSLRASAYLSVAPVCQAGLGGLAGELKNTGTESSEYLISVFRNSSAGPVGPSGVAAAVQDNSLTFERLVEPGGSATIDVGDLSDGSYVVSVSGASQQSANEISTQQEAQINCANVVGTDYRTNVSCLAANGRIDVALDNYYSRNARYQVVVDGKIKRTLTLAAGDKRRTTIVGLADGDHTFSISRTQILNNGEYGATDPIVDSEVFSVTCDGFFVGSNPVDIKSWCENGSGRVSIYAKNDDVAGSDFLVTTGAVAGAKGVAVPARETALLEFEGLDDGKIAFIVKRNSIEIGRPGATIDCS